MVNVIERICPYFIAYSIQFFAIKSIFQKVQVYLLEH